MPDSVWKGLSEVIKDKLTEDALLNRPPKLKTGFAALDKVLGGGLSPGLTVLGGVSNVGKSTFALQLAERLAAQVPVLYYALEMTGEYIGAKMISRRLFQTARAMEEGGFFLERIREKCVSADRIINSADAFSPDLWRRIGEARRWVEERARELYVMETALSAQKIALQAEQFMEEHPGKKPVVIVDYLQILPPENPAFRNERQAVDDSIRAMVGLAREGVTVLLISALSRGTHEVRMDSFKESGSIEYSADVLLGLQFQASRRQLKKGERFDDLEEKGKEPREVEIVVLKQRYGECGRRIPLSYYSKYDCFEETERLDICAALPAGEAAPYLSLEVPEQPGYVFAAGLQAETGWQDAAAPDAALTGFAEVQEPDAEQKGQGIPQAQEIEKGEEWDSSIPRSVMCNTKIANEIRKGASGREIRCEVMKGVFTTFSLLPEALTYADCDVADAVYTLFSKYERDSFTIGQVLRILSGDGRQTLTKQKRQEIEESIERLRNTSIEIFCEEEMQEREKKKEHRMSLPYLYQGAFLNVRKEDKRYFFEEGKNPMPLYGYGEQTRQMISFPSALLQVRGGGGQKLRDSAETVFVKRYLIRRLEILRKNPRKKNDDFRYISLRDNKDLAVHLRLSERFPSKERRAQKRRRLQVSVLEILEYFKEISYITEYDYQEAAQSVKIIGGVKKPWKLPALRPGANEISSENTDEKP